MTDRQSEKLMTDRHSEKPNVIRSSSGNGAWGAVIIVALLLAAAAWYMSAGSRIPNGPIDGAPVNTPVEAPKIDTPAPPAETPLQPAPAAPATPPAAPAN